MNDTRLPNNDEVICPNCVHQFRAIPVNAQTRIAELEAALADAIKRAEAAEKDAERYRWIRDQCTWGDIYTAIGRDGWLTPGHIICGMADHAITTATAKEGER